MNEFKHTIIKKEVDGSHYYFVDGEFYPSVTRILEEAAPTPYSLKEWFKNNSIEKISAKQNESLEFGSKMHDAFEKLLGGVELNLEKNYQTTREKKHILSFVEWFRDNNPKVLNTEFTVASISQKYAGTLDLLCVINDERWLIDFKTSAAIYESYEWQVSAYKKAYEEMFATEIHHTGILKTGTRHKTGYEFKEVNRPFAQFQTIYQTYLNVHGGTIPEPPSIDVYPTTISLYEND